MTIPYRTSQQIRADFIQFFQARAHSFIPSSSIAPLDDPTLLFINAGMNQFKSLFLGENPQGLKRAANSQKCLRVSGKHNDLEEVGKDGTHHTFFEMLGNWSFGDYYKKEAITWAWELLTQVWQVPKERLFVTIYHNDDETEQLWKEHTDIDPSRILRFTKENFWEMGAVGPCGPCTEIHYDKGDLATQEATYRDPIEGVNGPNERYMEVWNLVFMQNERIADGSLRPLKATHVDTGCGLERITAVVQGVNSNYDTDLFRPLLDQIASLSGVPYEPTLAGMPHRVMADHIRALTFAITDGVTPGNEGRGYVMRRILRRASRYAHKLGQKEPFLHRLVPTVVSVMASAFPELAQRAAYVAQVIESEEKRFLRTLDQGLTRLQDKLQALTAKKEKVVPGEEAFLLHDTFGFPVDLTTLLVEEQGFSLDVEGYTRCMGEQQTRARQAAKFDGSLTSEDAWVKLLPNNQTEFTGYLREEEPAVRVSRYAEAQDTLYVVLEKTPFYAQAGGQVGDQGELFSAEVRLRVVDTFTQLQTHIHKCELIQGLVTPKTMATLTARVDGAKRAATRKNHSATHLLHASLHEILGPQAEQKGSYVGPDRLRFDFHHNQALTKSELRQIERRVNEEIQRGHPVDTQVCSLDEAKATGAQALFGEKYGDHVRVLTMGAFSKELCGGTHVSNTGEIGLFQLVSESSIAAGVRRIEGLTGIAAMEMAFRYREDVEALSQTLKVIPEQVLAKVEQLAKQAKDLERELAERKSADLQKTLQQKLHTRQPGTPHFVSKFTAQEVSKDSLQQVLDFFGAHLSDGVAVVTHVEAGQLAILVSVGTSLATQFSASDLLQEIGKVAEARGGGRKDKARAGSRFPEKEDAVLEAARQVLFGAPTA